MIEVGGPELTDSRPPYRRPIGRLRQGLWIGLGIVATTLGLVGLVVPLLPTTPLLLLAAASFARSSDRMYSWLIGNRWFGHIIRSYREHRAVPRHAKIIALVVLWSAIGSSAILVDLWWVRGLLAVIASLVTVHVSRLKTIDFTEMTHVTATPHRHLRRRPKTHLTCWLRWSPLISGPAWPRSW